LISGNHCSVSANQLSVLDHGLQRRLRVPPGKPLLHSLHAIKFSENLFGYSRTAECRQTERETWRRQYASCCRFSLSTGPKQEPQENGRRSEHWFNPLKLKLCYDRRSVGQSVLMSIPIWGTRSVFCYCQTVVGLLIWGTFSDERRSLSFKIAAGPRQHSYSRVRVPRES
jgi:hypothetical protein